MSKLSAVSKFVRMDGVSSDVMPSLMMVTCHQQMTAQSFQLNVPISNLLLHYCIECLNHILCPVKFSESCLVFKIMK